MCNGLYLGTAAGQPRPNPVWTNPAIKPIADQLDVDDIPGHADSLDPNLEQHIRVTVKNSRDYPINALIELYWSDPTTGFLADPTRLIEYVRGTVDPSEFLANIPVAGATAVGDGSNVANYVWVPHDDDPTAETLNGGHVCLLARISHNGAPLPGGGDCGGDIYDASSPTTDYRSAIHNIMLVAGGAGKAKSFKFAFAATNPFNKAVGTKLTVRPILPEKHAPVLERLLGPARNYRFAARGNKFGTPAALGVALGRERIIARPMRAFSTYKKAPAKFALGRAVPIKTPVWSAPRLGNAGVLTAEKDQFLRANKYQPAEHQALDLLPYEIRQGIVIAEPEENADLYAFEVIHETTEPEPRLIGGITFLYRTRKRLF